jgi:hypothetical protein
VHGCMQPGFRRLRPHRRWHQTPPASSASSSRRSRANARVPGPIVTSVLIAARSRASSLVLDAGASQRRRGQRRVGRLELKIRRPKGASESQHRKLARWGAETRARNVPLDEVPEGVRRISIPADDPPESQRPVDADEAQLALELQQLRRALRRARWIPWRRRKRPMIQTTIDQLAARRRQLRGSTARVPRRL